MSWCPRGRREWGVILTPPGVHLSTRLQLTTLHQHTHPPGVQGHPQWGGLHLWQQRQAGFPGSPQCRPSGCRFGLSGEREVRSPAGLKGLESRKQGDKPGVLLWSGLGTGRGLLWFESSTSVKGGNRRLSYRLVWAWSTVGRGRVRFKSYQ